MGFESPNRPDVRVENAPLLGSISLDGVYLLGPDKKEMKLSYDLAHIPEMSYNVNSGVILIKESGRKLSAMPYTEDNIAKLEQGGFVQDGRMGVPHLYNKEVWGAPEGETFKRWEALVTRADLENTKRREESGSTN